MTQREITKLTLLLNEKGNLLQPGYAREMLYLYNRERAAGKPFGLKEWDFYQLALGEWVLQMTVGHVSYMANFSANLISLKTGERLSFNRMRPLPMRGMDMPLHPNRHNRLCAKGKGFSISFVTEEKYRTLRLNAENGDGPVDIEMTLPHRTGDEAMVIATPFEKPGQFYLNCKEHFYGVKGHARFGNLVVEAHGEETALLDWGRGVWPFHQEWFWGCGAGQTDGGRFGFNIGWGFGNIECATENMFFWNGKAYKLGAVFAERDKNDYMAPWHYTSDNESFDLTMTPVFDNDTSTKFAFVSNRCHQVFGRFNGTAVLTDGKTIRVENLLAFCEHAVNNW